MNLFSRIRVKTDIQMTELVGGLPCMAKSRQLGRFSPTASSP